jgi:transcriptional regulator with XRE-family HTH domain
VLARRAGVSATRIGDIERGRDGRGIRPRPRPETLHRLAQGLSAGATGAAVPEAAAALYRRLMAAAGYAEPGRPPGLGASSGSARALLTAAPHERAAVVRALRALADALAALDDESSRA